MVEKQRSLFSKRYLQGDLGQDAGGIEGALEAYAVDEAYNNDELERVLGLVKRRKRVFVRRASTQPWIHSFKPQSSGGTKRDNTLVAACLS